jgi:WD repeat-containing protein 35
LATKNNVKDIETLLSTYATLLLNQGRELDAIELLRKANYHDKSAALLYKMAKSKHSNQPMMMKKLYVLAGLEVERHKASSKRYKNISVIYSNSYS